MHHPVYTVADAIFRQIRVNKSVASAESFFLNLRLGLRGERFVYIFMKLDARVRYFRQIATAAILCEIHDEAVDSSLYAGFLSNIKFLFLSLLMRSSLEASAVHFFTIFQVFYKTPLRTYIHTRCIYTINCTSCVFVYESVVV